MIFIGIDPGKVGAIGVIDNAGVASAYPMPVIPGARAEYDIPALARELLQLREAGKAPLFAILEKGQPLPRRMGGGVANYHRGYGRGLCEGLLVALGIPYQLVAPRTWQKVLHEGTPGADTKQRSILAAQRLFPAVDLRRTERARKPDDGIAEALLLAEYGRRVQARGVESGRG